MPPLSDLATRILTVLQHSKTSVLVRMRHLRLEAMFHLIWALWHAIQYVDAPVELLEISRSNLQQLPDIFVKFIEELDPSKFWKTDEAKELQVTSVEKLSIWNEFIDDYMTSKSEWPSSVLFAAY